MVTSTLVKTLLHNSVADSVFSEVTSGSSKYFYFLGSVLDWIDPLTPPTPVDSIDYERQTRQNIVLVKQVLPGDISYVVDRIDWVANTTYDMYDDQYSDQVIGIDLAAGGVNYSSNVIVTITGGSGTGANAIASVANGAITAITVTNKGTGFTSEPSVIITDVFGSDATANAVLNYAYSGAANIQSAQFYVVTDEFNIYKCLDNNNNSISTAKPSEVSAEPFFTSDGYKWKFMGAIPISLRNKFLTTTQIPVTTSITNQFYSRGAIREVEVLDTGNNYTYGSIVVQGDGYLEDEPYLVINYDVVSGGNAVYTTANVTIDPPVAPSSTWLPSTVFNVGQILQHENNLYQVIQAGSTASYSPVHTVGVQRNGNTILKYRGTQITANAIISSGNIIGLANLYGMVRDIVITENGSGYTAAPVITLSGGSGINATAYATITNGVVSSIDLLDAGKDYTVAPNVTIGTQWVSNAFAALNTQVFYGPRLYTISTSGYGNTTPPTHTSGIQTLGNAAFTFAGTAATAYARLKYGSGYTRSPQVTVTGDGSGANIVMEAEKTEAVVVPYIENGKITRVGVVDGGIGYTYATLTIVGDGSNAEVRVNFSKGDLETLQSTSELLAVPGAIHAAKVISGGYGYSNATVAIYGNGNGATANAVITNGRVSRINIVTEGSGYTQANVVISGNGSGASARPILPPYNGHGRDTVAELYSRSLGFYSTISQEKNQGFIVNNDYRQFGIIKNIRDYTGGRFYTKTTGSTLWLISGTIDSSIFTTDTVTTRTSDGEQFLIISSTDSGALVISLSGKAPSIGDGLSISTGSTLTITGVTEPDVDKYSGELLYIDNKKAFTSTEDQAVSLKTVFKY